MVAVDDVTAAGLPGRPVGAEDELKRRIVHLLSRSLADEGIGDDLIGTLDEVLSDRPGPAAPDRKIDALLIRWGLPVPRRRPPTVAPLTAEEAARITDRFRRATRQLMQVVPPCSPCATNSRPPRRRCPTCAGMPWRSSPSST